MATRGESGNSTRPKLAVHKLTVNRPVDDGVETMCMLCGQVVGRWWYSTEGTLYGEGINIACRRKPGEQPTVVEDVPGRTVFRFGDTLTKEHFRTLIACFEILGDAKGLLETAAERIDLAHSGKAVPPWGPLLAAIRAFIEKGDKHPEVMLVSETGATLSLGRGGSTLTP